MGCTSVGEYGGQTSGNGIGENCYNTNYISNKTGIYSNSDNRQVVMITVSMHTQDVVHLII